MEINSGYSTEKESLYQFNENICFCAGAGSGKTSVLVKMYLALISGDSSFNEPIPIERVVAITFTEKAAAEMKKRVREAVEQKIFESEDRCTWEERLRNLEKAHIKTIHGFCTGILREYPVEAAVDPAFTILDEYETSEILERVVHEVVVGELDSRDVMVNKLVHDYGFSGYNQLSGLKEFLKGICRETHGSGLDWDTIDQMQKMNYQRSEGLLNSKVHSIEEGLGSLIELFKNGAVKKSTKSYSKIEELIRHYRAVADTPGNDLVKRGGALVTLEDHMKGSWPVVVKDLQRSLKESISEMKGAYYQLLIRECLDGFQKILKKVSYCFKEWKSQRGMLDFDDLQIRVRDILKNNRKIRRDLKNRFKVIMLDEFQDTNSVQKEIVYYLCEDLGKEGIFTESGSYQDIIRLHPKKLFFVGDPKQSIYRFRGADVTVFLEMQSALSESEVQGKKVYFSENFRSQKGIVEFSNLFFSSIMSGGSEKYEVNFSHDDHQEHQRQLHDEGVRVELIKINRGKNSEQKRRIEASAISRRILEIVQPGSSVTVYEKGESGKEKRKAHPEFSDIAILFRRFTHIKLYEREMRKRNIPYYVVKGRGFFGCQEIKDIVNFLKYLDGENDDVALVGILRSPLVGISDETLYWLFRGVEKGKKSFAIADISERFIKVKYKIDNIDGCKIETIFKLLNQLKGKKDRLSLAELIECILKATHYDSIMLTTFQGEQKVANIKKLIELSRDFARRETGLLRDFITYLSKFIEEDVMEPESQTSLENANVVRLMTIHQAKGLEFPIVFLPDMGHSLSRRFDNIIFDESKGIALKMYQNYHGTYESTMVHKEITELLKKKEYAESKRLFYVAATRARDYLVLSGERPRKNITECWRGWLDQFLEHHPEWVCEVEEENISDLSSSEGKTLYQLDQGYQRLEKVGGRKIKDLEGLSKKVLQQACFYTPSPVGEVHITVTALSEYMVCPQRFYYEQYLGLDEKIASDIEVDNKRFLEEGGKSNLPISNLEKGNLVHFILEHIDFRLDLDIKRKQIDNLLLKRGFSLASSEVNTIKEDLLTFLSGDLGIVLSRLREGHIFREVPFIFRLQEDGFPYVIVLQGIIDLLFQDSEGVWTVVDYKYSAGREMDREQYRIQLMAYALAVARRMKQDKVKALIKTIGEKEKSLKEWEFEEIELRNINQKITGHACEVARKQIEDAPSIWVKGEDCKYPDCAYQKRCNS